jgi:hypothetical protein
LFVIARNLPEADEAAISLLLLNNSRLEISDDERNGNNKEGMAV